ncbi:UV-endonuclease UvdE [Neolentinus lepideus HHB14362 ss-1]|uniref:UV-endonuclease UvdE n=1 Tax=Neolentinus lepideus HHB14362 ss-1 TaxID=1314782 RepID=A0A165V2Q4_9AGAM|nr:UV-endonuclease UvdE [Neolentinus lepideus HHB14362 ss-1]
MVEEPGPESESDSTPLENDSTDKRKRKGKTRKVGPADEEGAVPKTRKPRPPKPEPVYVIPDVEKKETTFKGRLGYACLNTILRNKKPASEAIFCSRTCRIDTIKKNGIEWVKELGRQNVKDLLKLIEWNEENNIRFMRMSSEMFPFASHPKYGYTLEYCAAELEAVGDLANRLGHRLTTHPGQFTQLGSPKDEVIANAVRDLTYHCEMIDRMGLGKDSVMIIHGGGTYGDKPAALARIKKSVTERLPQNVRNRLVLENDEMCYSAEDLLPLCEELNIPLVFDYHHDWINPSSIAPAEIIRRANAIFERRGIKPKQHLSEPRPGAETVMEKRAHADRCQKLPDDLPDDMDLMVEAKDKEQAVLHLYRIYGLRPVIHASLRPPAEHETKETKGRKSLKKKAVKTGIIADDLSDEDSPVTVDVGNGTLSAVGVDGDSGASESAPAGSRKKTRRQAKSERTRISRKREKSVPLPVEG